MDVSQKIFDKAQKLVDEGKVEKYDEDTFYVKGESDTWEVKWDVDMKTAISCGCKWYQMKHNVCSHITAVNIFYRKSDNNEK